MNCRHCRTPLEAGQNICPKCGLDNRTPEIPDKKPINTKKLILVIAVAVLLVAAIGLIVWAMARTQQDSAITNPTDVSATDGATDGTDGTGATEDAITAEDLAAHPVLNRDTYTYEGEDLDSIMDQVVLTTNGAQLTNGQFSIWYWQSYYDMVNSLGYYASLYGLDTTKPLDEQTCHMSQVPMTWEQFLIEQTISNWQSYVALCLEAEKAGLTLSQENQEQLDGIEENIASSASLHGFDSAEAVLQADYGAGVTIEDYKEFMRVLMLGDQYYQQQVLTMTPTEQEVGDYYTEHQTDFIAQGILQDGSPATVDVRHILIQTEEDPAETDASGRAVYSEAQMTQMRADAQALLDQWLAGEATEESFAALVAGHTADNGSAETGGLYEDVSPGQMVTNFNNWCFDPERQPGDNGLVDSEFGVHIMYFVAASETEYWYTQAESQLLNERVSQWVASVAEQYPTEEDFANIHLSVVETSTAY